MNANYVFLLTVIVAVITGCNTQQTICENVNNPEQLPWLRQIVEKGEDYGGNKLLKIDKVKYIIENTGVKGTGFVIYYDEPVPQKSSHIGGVYDCDGQAIVTYGGVVGCQGECSLKVLSSTTIYTVK